MGACMSNDKAVAKSTKLMDKSVSETSWYFAIGSMMNKVSINSRDIFPSESKPAEIQDFKLIFFGPQGAAMAEAVPGESFHGVLHKCTEKEMLVLDKIELSYDRVKAKAKLYDGTLMDCTVYSKSTDASLNASLAAADNKPPTERYVDIMKEGCVMYGVKQEYIDHLTNMEMQPRTKPEDFMCLGGPVPEGLPTWTFDMV